MTITEFSYRTKSGVQRWVDSAGRPIGKSAAASMAKKSGYELISRQVSYGPAVIVEGN